MCISLPKSVNQTILFQWEWNRSRNLVTRGKYWSGIVICFYTLFTLHLIQGLLLYGLPYIVHPFKIWIKCVLLLDVTKAYTCKFCNSILYCHIFLIIVGRSECFIVPVMPVSKWQKEWAKLPSELFSTQKVQLSHLSDLNRSTKRWII